jgi:hypothetical protein
MKKAIEAYSIPEVFYEEQFTYGDMMHMKIINDDRKNLV